MGCYPKKRVSVHLLLSWCWCTIVPCTPWILSDENFLVSLHYFFVKKKNFFSRTRPKYTLKMCTIDKYMDENYIWHKSCISQEATLKMQWLASKDSSDGIHSLLGQFTDFTFSREENKNKVTRCGFFNLSNCIFLVSYKKTWLNYFENLKFAVV